MTEIPEILPLDQIEETEHQSEDPEILVGTITANYSDLVLSGLAFSRDNKGGMDDATYNRYLSTWSQLGNQPPGPELTGVDGTGESGQE